MRKSKKKSLRNGCDCHPYASKLFSFPELTLYFSRHAPLHRTIQQEGDVPAAGTQFSPPFTCVAIWSEDFQQLQGDLGIAEGTQGFAAERNTAYHHQGWVRVCKFKLFADVAVQVKAKPFHAFSHGWRGQPISEPGTTQAAWAGQFSRKVCKDRMRIRGM